jgi:hypothetical protein
MVRIRLVFIEGFAIYSRPAERLQVIVSRGHFCCCDGGGFKCVQSCVMCMAEECLPGRPEMSDCEQMHAGCLFDWEPDFVQVAGRAGPACFILIDMKEIISSLRRRKWRCRSRRRPGCIVSGSSLRLRYWMDENLQCNRYQRCSRFWSSTGPWSTCRCRPCRRHP